MGTPFLGEIKMAAFDFAPQGWALANGQFLPINQNQALFSLFGTQYGGNGQTTFAIPNMRGRVALHMGAGFIIGQAGGQEVHTLTQSEMPQHLHFAQALADNADDVVSAGNMLAAFNNGYGPPNNLVSLHPATISNVGGSQPHQNMSPYTVISFMVALIGVFPSRN